MSAAVSGEPTALNDESSNAELREPRRRNVILFVGDGMGISTLTAARILEGQKRGEPGEENSLSFEEFPHLALVKTYAVNQQTADSAPTMTAIITGVKTKDGLLSVDENVVRGDYKSVAGNELPTLLEHAEEAGLATGIVSTARLTHATPGACYAHSAERDWEADTNLPPDALAAEYPDIARQLIEFRKGDGIEVALGGGRAYFQSNTAEDPEDKGEMGLRADGRDLAAEWAARPSSAYVWNKQQFDAIDPRTQHVLGLFERSHMEWEIDRGKDSGGEPSLTEMTTKAIELLSRHDKGYFLMVEAGRIDQAHHAGNARRALEDTIELSNAVRAAAAKVDPSETTLLVTADHSHAFIMAGWPVRGNPILGKVIQNDEHGEPEDGYALDDNGLPYTTLTYANGPGHRSVRPDLSAVDTEEPDFLQEATVPLRIATHGGEDVAVFATGPAAPLVHGLHEQTFVFDVMARALRLAGRR